MLDRSRQNPLFVRLTLSGWTAADIGGLSGQTGISMPGVTKRGIPNYGQSSPNGRKIVHKVFAHFDAGNGEMRNPLSRIEVQQALSDDIIRGWCRQWRANRLWMRNNNDHDKGHDRIFTGSEEQILADRIREQHIQQHALFADQDFQLFAIATDYESHFIDAAATTLTAAGFVASRRDTGG
jgi:hypothetical protein